MILLHALTYATEYDSGGKDGMLVHSSIFYA